MAGFVQIWSSQQLEKGAPGCPDYHGTTGPNTHAIVLSNDSENTLLYRSDVDPGLYVPPRTSLTIPCDSNMQYVLSVDASSTPTTTSDQLVILSETNQELAYSSTQLPLPNLIQYIATIYPGNIHLVIPPQFTAIVVVPIDAQTNLTIAGIDSTFAYYNGPFTEPLTIQLYPGMDPSGLDFLGSGGGTTNVYGLTLPLTEIGTSIRTLAELYAQGTAIDSLDWSQNATTALTGLVTSALPYARDVDGFQNIRSLNYVSPGALNAHAPGGLVTIGTGRLVVNGPTTNDRALNVAAGSGVNGALGTTIPAYALIKSITFSAILRGSSLGASEAECMLSFGGIVFATLIVSEGVSSSVTLAFDEPVTLNNGSPLNYHFNNNNIVGTIAADMSATVICVQ